MVIVLGRLLQIALLTNILAKSKDTTHDLLGRKYNHIKSYKVIKLT
jgi:hypothetical protein